MSHDVMRILNAAVAAAKWHAHQRRKGAAEEPYINHLLEVASLVAEATGGRDSNLIIAALLHDAIEDQAVPRATIAAMFGEDVAALVAEVTDDKSLEESVRKRLQVEHAVHKSNRAKVLKLADKISNVRDITVSPPAGWSLERRRDYVRWGREVAAGLAGVSPALEKQFQRVADDADNANRGSGS
jgi:guanosine-3',5'-bis(diphosphate) 3'-pyrophosphohydrolase